MSVQKSLLSATFAYSLLIIVHLFGQTASLTCYENDAYGNLYEVSNSTWNYCALVPSSTSRYGEGRVFGVGPTGDWTEAYDETFALSDKVYKILTICILEKYDFGQLSPKFGPNEPEFMFRCVCNYDRCNRATTFSAYLSAVREDNTFSK